MRCGLRSELVAGVSSLARVLAIVAALVCAACSPTSEGDTTGQSGCVTDLSCPFGEECDGTGCAPIAATLFPHIQTASTMHRGPLDDAELTWRAQHFDLMVGGIIYDEQGTAMGCIQRMTMTGAVDGRAIVDLQVVGLVE